VADVCRWVRSTDGNSHGPQGGRRNGRGPDRGEIVEHWDIARAAPEKAADDNTML